MSDVRILTETAGAVLTVSLNRPEVHNAFDELLIRELTDVFTLVSADAGVRVVILTGAGASFCAGADLDWMRRMAAYGHEENLADARNLQRMFAAIADCPKLTLARVNGAALGGGAGLIAVCDFAVCVDSAKVGFTEVRLGLAPAVISPYVVAKIGPGRARNVFLTGERIGVAEALRIGLIDEVTDTDSLDSAVGRRVDSALQCGPEAIAATKRLLRQIQGQTPAESAEVTVESIAGLRASHEGQEGIRAFLEKRKPPWAPESQS